MHCIEKSELRHMLVYTNPCICLLECQLIFGQVLQPITDKLNMSTCLGFNMFIIQVCQAWHHVTGGLNTVQTVDATALSLAFAVLLLQALHWPLLQFLQTCRAIVALEELTYSCVSLYCDQAMYVCSRVGQTQKAAP